MNRLTFQVIYYLVPIPKKNQSQLSLACLLSIIQMPHQSSCYPIFYQAQDYIQTEGDDGPFANEIYNYTLKLRHIMQQILLWRPQRIEYFGISFSEADDTLFQKVFAEIREKEGHDIVEKLDQHAQPFYFQYSYVFATEQERDTLMAILTPHFHRNELDLEKCEACLCDGGCEDYLDISDSLYWHNDWLYCESCLNIKDVGDLDIDRLQSILAYFEQHNEECQRIINNKHGDFDRYKKWIRRACHIHKIDFPDWIIDL